MTYPLTRIARRDYDGRYPVRRHLMRGQTQIKGYISKGQGEMWVLDIATRYHGQRCETHATFAQAREAAIAYLD